MKKYLTPTDGSRGADKALAYAIARAREAKAEVHVLHVVPPPAYDDLESSAVRGDLGKIRSEAQQRILASAMDQLRAERIPCTPHLMDGPAAETILRFAETQKIDEIIMGSRGLGAIGNFLLGSVSSKVAHLAAIPVTLVK